VVNVTVVASAQGAENVADVGPLVIVQVPLSGSFSGSVAWPKRVRSLAGKDKVLSGPALTVGAPARRAGGALPALVTVAVIVRRINANLKNVSFMVLFSSLVF
jgi:hypothetical protein